MADTQIEKAFGSLAEAFTTTENHLNDEIGTSQQQIDKLKEKLNDLSEKQKTLVHDREAISAMYKRYCNNDGNSVTF